MRKLDITVLGAGILGIWQTLTLARRGHRVRLLEASEAPFTSAASRYAGAMLAPYCELPTVHNREPKFRPSNGSCLDPSLKIIDQRSRISLKL